jgi:DNA repair exonuclease SbcCD ATPase subunit
MSTDTPRVDAAVTGKSMPTQEDYKDLARLAREIERALNAHIKHLAEIRKNHGGLVALMAERDQREIVKLIERLEKAERELAEAQGTIAMLRCMIQDGTNAMTELDQLRARVAELEADKARLDWLSINCTHAFNSERYLRRNVYWGGGTHRTLRQAIDAARTP